MHFSDDVVGPLGLLRLPRPAQHAQAAAVEKRATASTQAALSRDSTNGGIATTNDATALCLCLCLSLEHHLDDDEGLADAAGGVGLEHDGKLRGFPPPPVELTRHGRDLQWT